jgi:membrane-associated phospholipid phosphatase
MWRLLVVLLPVVLALSVAAAFVGYFAADLWFTRLVQSVRQPAFHWTMIAISWIGYTRNFWPLVGGLALLLALLRLRLEAACLLLSAAGGGLLATLLKLLTARPRPTRELAEIYILHPSHSFPSGHVVNYVALYGFIFYLVYVRMARSPRRAALLAVCAAMIALVGPSRVYLGAHWGSDVVGGYAVGAVWLLAVIEFYWRMRLRRALRPHRD